MPAIILAQLCVSPAGVRRGAGSVGTDGGGRGVRGSPPPSEAAGSGQLPVVPTPAALAAVLT
ncbi:hypothetical protein GCM10010207_31660 [Streptomyces atratus]|nr:hypothetical protein GCM10010207_31660 [Streptomyces atratus]